MNNEDKAVIAYCEKPVKWRMFILDGTLYTLSGAKQHLTNNRKMELNEAVRYLFQLAKKAY